MTPTPQASDAHSAAGHSTELPTLDFLYDWRGRRISKQVTYGSGNTATSTSYIYDGWNIVATLVGERNTYNNLEIVRSDWGLDLSGSFQGAGGVGGLLATRTTDSNFTGGWTGTYVNTETARHFPSYDGNGNIIAWTTDTGGTTTTRDFDAFGNVVTNQGTRWSASTAFGFSTKYEDEETGLLYYGYRYYDPVTGRWPSRDPIGERDGFNLYGMVGNDAVGAWDYLGLDRRAPVDPDAKVVVPVEMHNIYRAYILQQHREGEVSEERVNKIFDDLADSAYEAKLRERAKRERAEEQARLESFMGNLRPAPLLENELFWYQGHCYKKCGRLQHRVVMPKNRRKATTWEIITNSFGFEHAWTVDDQGETLGFPEGAGQTSKVSHETRRDGEKIYVLASEGCPKFWKCMRGESWIQEEGSSYFPPCKRLQFKNELKYFLLWRVSTNWRPVV